MQNVIAMSVTIVSAAIELQLAAQEDI